MRFSEKRKVELKSESQRILISSPNCSITDMAKSLGVSRPTAMKLEQEVRSEAIRKLDRNTVEITLARVEEIADNILDTLGFFLINKYWKHRLDFRDHLALQQFRWQVVKDVVRLKLLTLEKLTEAERKQFFSIEGRVLEKILAVGSPLPLVSGR